jgi:fructose-bisphosphate aldolase class I
MTAAPVTSPATSTSAPGRTALRDVAHRLVGEGRGILAADESIATMNTRLAAAGVAPEEVNRRDYRELLVTAPGLTAGVSGVILCEETLLQALRDGEPFGRRMLRDGLLPGVKVDTGTAPLPNTDGETITEGLDGLARRLPALREAGAAFAKWRAVIRLDGGRPSPRAVQANAHALARYAVLCQAAGIVPIVEPEVLMDGEHGLSRCAVVTASVLREVFRQLLAAGADLRAVVLKPNMVLPGRGHHRAAGPAEVAEATLAVLGATVPATVAGVAFLSGGQAPQVATANLAALQGADTAWPLTFSFGRALVDPALAAWAGRPENWDAGQQALLARVQANAAAVGGS